MPPIVNFFSKDDPEGSDTYVAAFVMGHSLFLLFNIINASFLVLVQWFALGQLNRGNTLLKLTFAGCFLQQFSCISSVSRWNTGDPYGALYGIPSAVFGILAHVPCDMAYLYLWFHRREQHLYVRCGCGSLLVLGVVLAGLTIVKWDETAKGFAFLIMYGMVSTVWHIAAVLRFRSSHANGKVRISESIASHDSIQKILALAILLDFGAVLIEGMGAPVFSNGAPGIHYSATILVMVYASRMDSLSEGSPEYQAIGQGKCM